MSKMMIHTKEAPEAIGTYSQAIKFNNLVFISGQIPLVPETMILISDNIDLQIQQMFKNLEAVIKATGGNLENIVKLTIYLMDLNHFPLVNSYMEKIFIKPYPARAVIGVAGLPKNALIEADAILMLGENNE
jgi:reactive intermediate/imine deaminase